MTDFPHVRPEQAAFVGAYRECFTNTGGNDPMDLLNDLQGPKGDRLLQTNIVVYLLAFGIQAQVAMLQRLAQEGYIEWPKVTP